MTEEECLEEMKKLGIKLNSVSDFFILNSNMYEFYISTKKYDFRVFASNLKDSVDILSIMTDKNKEYDQLEISEKLKDKNNFKIMRIR